MANDITLGIKIKLDGREVDGQVRLLLDDLNRLSNATRDQGASASDSAAGNQRLRNSLRDTGAEAQNAGRSLRQMARDTFDLNGALRGLAAGLSALAIYQTAKEIVQIADNMTLLAGRINVAVSSAGEYARAYQDVLAISLQTHTQLDANATLFARTNKAVEQLGGTSRDTAKLTKTVAESLRISNASTSEITSVVRQFSQALASGLLRGDEFNSIMENGSRLAFALAEGLNVDIGTLRKMAEAGELSASRVITALLSQSEVIDREFAKLPLTVGAAFQDIKTQFENYIHQANTGAGATRGLAESVELLAVNLGPVLDSILTLGKVALVVFAGQMVGAIGQYIAAKAAAIAIENAHAAAITMDLARTVELTAAALAQAQADQAAAAAALAATQARIAQTEAAIAASVTISRHIALTQELNVLQAQQTAQTTALASSQAALASAQTAAAEAAAAQSAANATLRASLAALLSPMNLINAGIAIFAGWQFASLLDQFESVRKAAHVLAGDIANVVNMAQYGFNVAGAYLSGRSAEVPGIHQRFYQLQEGINASVADSLSNDKGESQFQGLEAGYKKFLQDQLQKAAEIKKQQEEDTAKKALLRTHIELLKTKGQLRQAYELEAAAIDGLTDAGRKQYVQEKLDLEAQKSKEKASDHAASLAKQHAKAEANRREEIEKLIAQIQFETSLIGLNDKERQRAIELTHALAKAKGVEVEQIKAALDAKYAEIDADARRTAQQEQSLKDAVALKALQDDAASAQHLVMLAKELQAQGLTNEAIRERIDLEKELATARKTYMSQDHDLDQKDIEKNITARKAAEAELSKIIDDGSRKSADFFQTQWKRAAENIQDTMADMFERLLNGDATRSFDDFIDNIRRSTTKVFAQEMSASIQSWLSSAFTSGSSGNGAGGFFSGMFDWIKNLWGGSTTPGISSNPAFAGPPAQGAIGNGANMFSSLFSTGQGGGFSMTSANGGGWGWGAAASLAKLIPGAGSYQLKGPQRNGSLETYFKISNTITDMIGNFFPWAKLIAPFKNLMLNLGSKLFPDRQPSMTGYAVGALANLAFPWLGPAGHLLATFLLGDKIPQPTSWTKGVYSGGKMTLGKSESFEGGEVQLTRDFTRDFGVMLGGVGRMLNQTFNDFRAQFWHQFDKTGDEQVAGGLGDKGGNFWLRQLSTGTLKELAGEAALAVVKHNIANQDDLHYRQAIRDSKGLKGLSNRIEQIDQIGLSIGEYGEALTQLKAINAQFDEIAVKAEKFRFTEAQVEAARQRAIDALKNDTLSAFRQLAGLGPTLAAQLGSLNDQLIALEGNARSLKLAESDLLGLRAKAIAQAREQYLAPLTDATASIADQIAQLTGNLPAAEDVAPLYELLKESTDPTEQARTIARIQSALTQRYNVEIAAINKTASAVGNLKEFLDSLKLSDLSPLDPESRLREARGQYGTTLLKAQAGDQAAMANLANTAQNYLAEAKSFYASTPEYAAIFSDVTGTLTNLNAELGGNIDANTQAADAQTAATEAANGLASSLQELADVINGLAATAGANFDQQAATLPAAPTAPAKTFQDLTEDQQAANIAALPANATKAEKAAVKAENKDLQSQIKAWLAGGEDELAKTQAYQALTDSIADVQEQLKTVKKTDPQYGPLKAELSGLVSQRKALGKVKFKEHGGWTDGLTIVGENGPELINFSRPTRVESNRQTQSIIAGGNDKLIAELQKANAELAALVRLQMQANQALLDRLDKIASASSAMERKTRLGSAA
jgi:tape measure domain-containing protein